MNPIFPPTLSAYLLRESNQCCWIQASGAKKSCFLILFLAWAYVTAAQHPHPHEAQITGFRIPDGEKVHYLQVGYYYNFNQRNAIGVRVSYHTRQKYEFYQVQSRYFEVSHRWRFQKPEKKFAWTLSSGPWMHIFASQDSRPNFGDSQSGSIGVATNGGLHYCIVPRFSVGVVGLTMLEVFLWELGGDRAFYPLIYPGIGVQFAYVW